MWVSRGPHRLSGNLPAAVSLCVCSCLPRCLALPLFPDNSEHAIKEAVATQIICQKHFYAMGVQCLGGPKWGVRFFSVTSKWRADDAMSLDFDTTNKEVRGKASVSFVCRASVYAVATQMSHTPHSVSPPWNLAQIQAVCVQCSRMQPFCLQLEASCLQLSFFDHSCVRSRFLLTIQAFLLTTEAFLLTIGACLLTMSKCVWWAPELTASKEVQL